MVVDFRVFFLSVEVEVTRSFEGAGSEAKEVEGRNEEVDEGNSIASRSCRRDLGLPSAYVGTHRQ